MATQEKSLSQIYLCGEGFRVSVRQALSELSPARTVDPTLSRALARGRQEIKSGPIINQPLSLTLPQSLTTSTNSITHHGTR